MSGLKQSGPKTSYFNHDREDRERLFLANKFKEGLIIRLGDN